MSEPAYFRGETQVPLPASVSVRPAERPASPPRATAEAAVVEMEYGNRSRNSRLGARLGTGPWKTVWKSELGPALQPPNEIMGDGDRIAVTGDLTWELYTAAGKRLGGSTNRNNSAYFDKEWGLLFSQDEHGRILAHALGTGAEAYSVLPFKTSAMRRILLTRTGATLMALSQEMHIDAHRPAPEFTSAETFNVLGPDNRKSWSDPGGPGLVQELIARDGNVLTASRGGTLVLARENSLLLVDSAELAPQTLITGKFRPLSMSLDEARRIYLLVDTGGQTALWMLSKDGELYYSCPMPPGFTGASSPPIVGYDHTVYLYRGRFVLAIGRDGKLNWSREGPGAISGAAITADDMLVVSEGSQIAGWNPRGERQVLHTFPEPLVTAPIVTKEGDLIAASRVHLFRASR